MAFTPLNRDWWRAGTGAWRSRRGQAYTSLQPFLTHKTLAKNKRKKENKRKGDIPKDWSWCVCVYCTSHAVLLRGLGKSGSWKHSRTGWAENEAGKRSGTAHWVEDGSVFRVVFWFRRLVFTFAFSCWYLFLRISNGFQHEGINTGDGKNGSKAFFEKRYVMSC